MNIIACNHLVLSLKAASGRPITQPTSQDAIHTYDEVGWLPGHVNTFSNSTHKQNNWGQKQGTWHPLVTIVRESPEMD